MAPHIRPLTEYVSTLRTKYVGWEFPDFDPMDGGTDANLLFLFEKPGPMTSPQHKRKGSGFISRDNNDPTAEATFLFMQDAGIDRKRTVLWNTIPGWNGKREIAAGETGAGIEELTNLLSLLPRVNTVVLVGNKAQRAESLIRQAGLRTIKSAHPGPLVKGPNRAMWDQIPRQWAQALSGA
ncbi:MULTISPECIES: uracil-DNA glycosylase [Pandoraea]|uniref:uracil-DNA glycosylase n=1 Tax=Pandoraea TaxID=93217 RepID=UPI001F5CF1B1|nr:MULTISPECIES: uracil-DNA glycosylase [Pandoraea]